MRDGGRLAALLDQPAPLEGHATERMDGRRVPIVLAVVRDSAGNPVEGAHVRLTQGNPETLRDRSTTNRTGVALLLFPQAMDAGHEGGRGSRSKITGRVEVLGHTGKTTKADVSIPGDRQHQVVELIVATVVQVTEPGGATPPTPPTPRLIDDPLSRLPADFSTELCRDVTRLVGPIEDPIMALSTTKTIANDFRKKRTPLLKRLTVPRLGEVIRDKNGKPLNKPNRYLVRLQQEWIFQGYTLGELAGLNALDPGSVVNEATQSVQSLVNSATQTLDLLQVDARSRVNTGLRSHAHIDTLLDVANTVKASAIAGGIGVGFGPFVAGVGGGKAKVTTTTAVKTSTDATLEVNSWLHAAASLTNRHILDTAASTRQVQETISRAIGQVSPLLSRVTNLLRWTLYENYMVCTHVEDVLQVEPVKVLELQDGAIPLTFTDEDIVELRRILSPALLEPKLRPRFDALSAAVDARRGAALPITRVHVDVTYSAFFASGVLDIGIAATTGNVGTHSVSLHRGGSHARLIIDLTTPTRAPDIQGIDLTLGLKDPMILAMTPIGAVGVPRIVITYESAHGYTRSQPINLANALKVDAANQTRSLHEDVTVPAPLIFTEDDPLVVHVNANRTFYFGALCEAALAEPALRDDCRFFSGVRGDHGLWRLPIVGFEGVTALVVRAPDANDKQVAADVKAILGDPGAATLVQLAAPGAYGEALEGLLSLSVDEEMIHPALLEPKREMVPVAIFDADAKTLTPVTGSLPTENGAKAIPAVPTLPVP